MKKKRKSLKELRKAADAEFDRNLDTHMKQWGAAMERIYKGKDKDKDKSK
jgi:hypothetical protein